MELTELLSLLTNSVVNPSAINTIRVGRPTDPTTPITIITPSLSQPVKLECERTHIIIRKNWYSDGTAVTPTNGELTTTTGNIRTLSISSFSPSHAKGYTCIVISSSLSATTLSTYPVILGE